MLSELRYKAKCKYDNEPILVDLRHSYEPVSYIKFK